MTSLFVVGSVVLFSSSGAAISSMQFARHYHDWRLFGFGFAFFLMLLMHFTDCVTWEGKWAIRIRTALLVVIALALLNGALLSWKDFPAAGLFFSVLGLPIYATAVHGLMASMPCLPRETGAGIGPCVLDLPAARRARGGVPETTAHGAAGRGWELAHPRGLGGEPPRIYGRRAVDP